MAKSTIGVNVKTKGGAKLKAALKKAQKEQGIHGVEVGFFENSRYPDGSSVVVAAALNEFGTETIPERPALRQANVRLYRELPELLKKRIDSQTMTVDVRLANEIGNKAQDLIRESIEGLSEPPNAPSTIESKSGSNPLVDTGRMTEVIEYRIIRASEKDGIGALIEGEMTAKQTLDISGLS